MVPIQFEGTNRIYRANGCFDLPARYDETEVNGLGVVPTITSVWELTTEDLINVLHSGKIVFTVIGRTQPPISLRVLDA